MDHHPTASAPLVVVGSKAVALDRATGAILWQYEELQQASRFEIIGDRVFVLDRDGAIHCLDLDTGARVGVAATGLTRAETMLADGDTLFVVGDGPVVAIDAAGRVRWRQAVGVTGSWGLPGLGVPGHVMQPDYSRD